jgi:hypothetical protein
MISKKEYKFIKLKKLGEGNKKKYMAIFNERKTGRERTVKFGAKGYEHFTDGHLDEKRKERYIKRHSKMNENWENPLTAGYWSKWYTWTFKTQKEALNFILGDLKKKGFL